MWKIKLIWQLRWHIWNKKHKNMHSGFQLSHVILSWIPSKITLWKWGCHTLFKCFLPDLPLPPLLVSDIFLWEAPKEPLYPLHWSLCMPPPSIYAHHYSTGTCCIIHLNNRSCHSDNTSTSVLIQEQKFQCLGFFCESDIAILSLKRQCHMLPFARHRTAGIMGP